MPEYPCPQRASAYRVAAPLAAHQFAFDLAIETGISQRLILIERQANIVDRVRLQRHTEQRPVRRLA